MTIEFKLPSIADGVDDAARLLRGGGAVEIHERMSADLLMEDRKLLANRRRVEKIGFGLRGHPSFSEMPPQLVWAARYS